MPPNIIVCLADQLRAHEVGCYGNAVARTPNLDRLAAESVRCEHAVTPNPVCLPARSSALSGQYSRTCSILGNFAWQRRDGKGAIMPLWPTAERDHLPDRTLPECLREAGYRTATIGKWHIEAWPDRVGFDSYLIPRVQHCHSAQVYTRDGGRPIAAEGFSVDWELAQVRRFLAERDGDRLPFFLYYNISPPHMPLADAPERYLSMFRPEDIPLRGNVDLARPLSDWERWSRIYLWDYQYYRDHMPYTRDLPPGFDLRALIALYYGNTTWLDDTVGGLLAALDEQGLRDDTLLVFAADHGDQLGSHGLWNKSVFFEESIRIPMLWRWPKGFAPRVVDRQVCSLVDLAPTLLAAAGVAPPAHMSGQELGAVLRGERESTAQPHAFIEVGGPGAAVRTTDGIYGRPWSRDGSQALDPDGRPFRYDLRADPFQLSPIAERDPARDELLERWIATTPWRKAG
jgi:choline-sulfatase